MIRQPDGQKFIGESRAPRVQIEYDVELYGSSKKVELPFVAGVMADLSGDNVEPLGPVEDRRFVGIDVDNFDQRMAEIGPELGFHVKNVLTDDHTLIEINLRFDNMEAFEPGEVVKRIPELAVMLEARQQLKELITYMDGKAAAEDVIEELLKNPKWHETVQESNRKTRAAAEAAAAAAAQAMSAAAAIATAPAAVAAEVEAATGATDMPGAASARAANVADAVPATDPVPDATPPASTQPEESQP
jgi:type VI secretion system protein ImpB